MKKAFTLIEVMLAIVIIGVVVAIVLPMIMRIQPNRDKAVLRKNYELIERLTNELINDDLLYPRYSESSNIPRGFAYYRSLNENKESTGKNLCKNLANKFNITAGVNCETMPDFTGTTPPEPSFTTNDGVDWYVFTRPICDDGIEKEDYTCEITEDTKPLESICNPNIEACDGSETLNNAIFERCSLDTPLPYICVLADVNGIKDGSNSFELSNSTDRFFFYIFYNGKITVPTHAGRYYLNSHTLF